MEEPNTLFLIARFGLKVVDTSGLFESWMWILDPSDLKMKKVSLHKTKSDRAYKGGQIVDIRYAKPEEFQIHQSDMKKRDQGQMNPEPPRRRIIVFQLDKSWKELWPQSMKTNPMAFKALGYVPDRH